ncbi:MAG TPA: TonB-dependent receptor [Rhodocyclaceae bacterium]|nr:TonB-dependent receptor [Rhodocyclaceae bacterium]
MKSGKLILVVATLPWAISHAFAQETQLPKVVISGERIDDGTVRATTLRADDLAGPRVGTSDSARMLEGVAGVSFYSGGGVSSLPVVDGLADDRLRISVDGMTITSACPNHMNPALSYMDASAVTSISVMAGITPVSLGGDSIGGTIAIRSASPIFAAPGEGLRTSGSLSGFYRSNGDASGFNAHAALAGESFSIGYTGSTVKSANYKDGNGKVQRSSEYESGNNQLVLAGKLGRDVVSLDIGWQEIPYQGYPNQYMDMTSNRSTSVNLRYQGGFDWGELEARAYRQRVRHKMDMLDDKANLGVMTYGMPYAMPMDTRAIDSGYALEAALPVAAQDVVRIGHEYHRYTLDDWWPPIPGSMMMGPDTFWNINGGKRERIALYGEWEAKWNPVWSSQLGVRYERVSMNTGSVQGYYDATMDMGMGIYQNDADAFNAKDHKRTDNNVDLTAAMRYQPDATSTVDFGFARKTRSPNIYERFAWSNESAMAGTMVSWFGDLNAYVGNLDLKPEVANTLRVTADWHDAERRDWQFTATPFYTRVTDYINAEANPNVVDLSMMGMASTAPGRAALRFVNHDARLYGLDLAAKMRLGHAGGDWSGRVVASYVNGKDLSTGGNLYNIMPLNGRLGLDHKLGAWSNSVELQVVGAKTRVDAVRGELKTAGYSLVNLRTGYDWGTFRLDAGIDNLFDKRYDLPLGGVDFYEYNYLSTATNGHLAQVRGPGRSINVGLTAKF